ncbi:hypothetical protein V6N12_063385 [Hibiscus sabdariffa]|uniref:Uncharacterized protein n=1 Tax=Hibiscus sabdariffa TaxID=183260 RepID=A0ABR2FBP9_9ROSI
MGRECLHREELLARGNRLLDECSRTFSGSRNTERRGPLLAWKRPASGWIKVNVDAAVNALDQRAFVGGVYRDSDGAWLHGFSRNIGRCSVVLAELWAILEALRRAWEKGYRFVVLESDCADAVRMILGSSEVFVGHALVAAIQSYIRRDWQLSISWIPRACNVCADRLVAFGRGQIEAVVDYTVPPTELLDLVMEEAMVSAFPPVEPASQPARHRALNNAKSPCPLPQRFDCNVGILFQEPVNSRRSVNCLSVASSDGLSEAIAEQKGNFQVEHETATVRAPLATLNNGISKYEFANGCSDTGLALVSMKDEMDENGECTSSSVVAAEVVREDLSEKDVCYHILQSQGNDDEVGPSRTCVNEEIRTTGGDSSCSRLCKTCGCSGTVQKMLICDSCEEAFHVRCCTPRIKKLPIGDWYCFSCMKNKRIMLKEATTSNASSITGGMGRCRDVSLEGEFTPIELMLRDTEPHRTSVRIGKGYQAEVPDWSGPIDNDVDTIGEPLELDPSEDTDFHELNCNKLNKLGLIGNWLQCRGFIEGVGGNSGTICGKWRWAPLFEVQTDNWECFCSFQWDPSHADCSIPQELETDEVLKQLKYVEMLRPRLSAE